MTTYQGIKGRTVQNLASDPPAAIGQGQVWYNTATDALKTSVAGTKVWAAGGNLPTNLYHTGAAGTLTAGLMFAGKPTPATFSSATATYDGNSWTSVNNVLTARQQVFFANQAPQTAAIMFGGTSPPGTSPDVNTTATEEYDGTSWTAGGAMTTARRQGAGGGTQTACFGAAGTSAPGAYINDTEEYNGTAWSSSNDYPANTSYLAGCGTQTAGLGFAGWNPGVQNLSAEYDGTSWAAGNNIGTSRYENAGSGIQTNALCFGGSNGTTHINASEEYDGTTWTATPNLATALFGLSGTGTVTALAIGGTPPLSNGSQEYVGPDTIETITTS